VTYFIGLLVSELWCQIARHTGLIKASSEHIMRKREEMKLLEQQTVKLQKMLDEVCKSDDEQYLLTVVCPFVLDFTVCLFSCNFAILIHVSP